MANVTINDTPSEAILAKAQTEYDVIDTRGRTIKLKKPSVLAQYRLIEILEDSAKNEVYMAMVLPLIYVTSIDGEVAHQPISKREVEAIIQQLDEDGINAVMLGVQAHFGAQNPEGDKAALKN